MLLLHAYLEDQNGDFCGRCCYWDVVVLHVKSPLKGSLV